jgi:hypothetical protein
MNMTTKSKAQRRIDQAVIDYKTRYVYVSCTIKYDGHEPYTRIRMTVPEANRFVSGFVGYMYEINRTSLVSTRVLEVKRKIARNYYRSCFVELIE